MTTHSWCTHLSGVSSPELQYCSDKSTTIACLSTEGREGETEGKTAALIWQLIRKVSGYNLPELLNLDLPISHFLFFFFFFSHLPPPIHPPPLRFGIANQPMCFLTGEAGDKERGVGRFSNRSMLFIFDCIYFILSVYLSPCHYMNVWFLAFVHTNAGGFLPVRAIKMDSVCLCVWSGSDCVVSKRALKGWVVTENVVS